jgi:hypothetical protein
MDEGDIDGVAVWCRIGEAVEALTRGSRKDELIN